jgi:hypothetical protein
MVRLISVVIGALAAAVLGVAAFNAASSHPPAAPHPAVQSIAVNAAPWKCPSLPDAFCG